MLNTLPKIFIAHKLVFLGDLSHRHPKDKEVESKTSKETSFERKSPTLFMTKSNDPPVIEINMWNDHPFHVAIEIIMYRVLEWVSGVKQGHVFIEIQFLCS